MWSLVLRRLLRLRNVQAGITDASPTHTLAKPAD